jgi:acetyl-CoA acetyltransferase
VRAFGSAYNTDHQRGDGLSTGLRDVATGLYRDAGVQPRDIDGACLYDDYPVMTLVQLEDLGLVGDGGLARLLRERVPADEVAINTSGGQLSAGQAGCAGGLHGLVEAVRQLSGRCPGRAWPRARLGIVAGYGMVQYRWGMCANAAILEACA